MNNIGNMLDECMNCILEKTDLENLLITAFNSEDEVFLTNAVVFIINSLILERVSENEKNKLLSSYGTIGYKKKDSATKDEIDNIKSELENNLSTGIADFFDAFKYDFDNEEYLLPRIRKLFKNYKFKKINIVNDYAILFFTFKLFDVKCDEEVDSDTLNEFADFLASACFNELHNPYNKKAVTVTCESLFRFVKQFVEGDHTDIYVRIMIDFVQALIDSESLPKHIKYDFFVRFNRHIELINAFLYFAQNCNNLKYSYIENDTDNARVNKFIYNLIQKIKKNGDSETVVAVIKELQKNMQWFTKNAPHMDTIPKKKIYNRCCDIYNSILKLKDSSCNNFEDAFSCVMQQYQSLSFTWHGKAFSVVEYMAYMLIEEGLSELKLVLKKHTGERNPFILLLFSVEDQKGKELHKYQAMYDMVMKDVRKIVYRKLPILSSEEYDRLTTDVNFDNFNISIFNVDIEEPYYKTAIQYIQQCI